MLITWFFLCLGVLGASAAIHTLQYFYSATSGIPNFPEFISLGMVDGQQTDYYDSKLKRAIPKVDWMSTAEGPEYWNSQTQTCVGDEQNFKVNIDIVKSRFNQTGGVHTVQMMYGCEWDDQTGETNGFRQYGYDGEDFLFLDLREIRWISPVRQGFSSVQKFNNDRAVLEGRKHYFSTVCIEWLKKYLQYGKSSLQKTVSPQVSLLQKDPSSPVKCHATGFYPSGVTITWMKNGQEHHEDVDLGELLPNEDGTFQKSSSIRVTPDEWKKNEYSCVVEHQGKTKTEDEINKGDSVPISIIVGVLAAVVLLIITGVAGYVVCQKKKVDCWLIGKIAEPTVLDFKPVNASDDDSKSSDPHAKDGARQAGGFKLKEWMCTLFSNLLKKLQINKDEQNQKHQKM